MLAKREISQGTAAQAFGALEQGGLPRSASLPCQAEIGWSLDKDFDKIVLPNEPTHSRPRFAPGTYGDTDSHAPVPDDFSGDKGLS